MRAKLFLFLGIFILLCSCQSSLAQKLSEEDALEGSANLMSPDDEDFDAASGLPPDDDEPRKASTFKPHFVTQANVHNIAKDTLATDAPIFDVTSQPDSDAAGSDHTMLIVAIGVIITVLILLVLVIFCCRKKKHDYAPGTPRV